MADTPITSFHLVNAHSMAASFTSAVQVAEFQDNVGIQLIWTGTPTGTFGVQVSQNYNPNVEPDTSTFTQLTLSPVPAASGSAGNYFIALICLPACYYQVTYTRTSGTGTLDVYIGGKGI
jgi:hypothetical protein